MTITVHGYALPWDKPAFVDGLTETAAPGCVAADTARNIRLLFGDHVDSGRPVYAQTRDRNLSLFVDDYGLGFTARLDPDRPGARGIASALASGSVTQCSVNFVNMHRRADGRIIFAQIDHIALVETGAYEATACWLGEQPEHHRPAHLRQLSARHLAHRLEATRRVPGRASGEGNGRAAACRHAPRPSASRPIVPQSVLALLEADPPAGMQNRYDARDPITMPWAKPQPAHVLALLRGGAGESL